MKIVQAYIKPHKLSAVSSALHHVIGVSGMTACDAIGWGRGKHLAEQKHAAEQVSDFEKHTKVEVVCADGIVAQVVEAIRQAAHTGLQGDGKILVSPIEDAVRISTGERGEPAC